MSLVTHLNHIRTPSAKLLASQQHCLNQLKQHDYTSYILAAYVPEPLRPAFTAIKAFNIQLSKIYGSGGSDVVRNQLGFGSNEFKLSTLQGTIVDVFKEGKEVKDPIGVVLRDALDQGLNLDLQRFETIFNTKKYMLAKPQFDSIDRICEFGEGYFSQFNYLVQNLLLSQNISPSTLELVAELSEESQLLITEIPAHLGQAQSVLNLILTVSFHATHSNQIQIPTAILAQHQISEEALLRHFQNTDSSNDHASENKLKEKMKDVIFELSTKANDHHLTAVNKLQQLQKDIVVVTGKTSNRLILNNKSKWKAGIPDCLYVPFMGGLSIKNYLNKLEYQEFDVLNKKYQNKPGAGKMRAVWDSWWGYRGRKI